MSAPTDSELELTPSQLEEIEDEWLARLDSAPGDVEACAARAELLAAAGEGERAAMLLEMADEHYLAAGDLDNRLRLLRRAGPLWLAGDRLHPEIVATLERLYADSPSYAGLAEHVGLFRAVDDIPKIWTKVDRLRALLAYDVGSVVWMKGNGAGQVTDVNLDLGSFRIDFDGHAGLTVGFGGAAKLLEPVAADHFLARRVLEPDTLRRLKDEDPPELLRRLLASYDEPLTAGRIREVLGDLVSEGDWTAFWNAARRHPQLVSSGKGVRQRYRWAASADAAHDAVEQAFRQAPLSQKLAIYRKDADRDPRLRELMESELAALAAGAVGGDDAAAIAVWAELDRRQAAPGDVPWSPQKILAGSPRPAALVRGIRDRTLREQAIGWLRELRADWLELFFELIAEEPDPRILDRLAEAVASEQPERLAAFVNRVLSQPRKLPAALAWLGERAAGELTLSDRQALKLLQRLLIAGRYEEFAPFRSRLRQLYEAGGPFPALFARLGERQAAAAADAIRRASLDDAVRGSLSEALELRFPALRQAGETPLYALPESIAAKREELKTLLEEEIPANRRAIEEAREMGDLRENFEYKSARQRHEYLAARAEALERDLRRVRPIELAADDADTVRLGCKVELDGPAGRRWLTILGPWESDPDRSVVSYESELAQQLVGAAVGERVTLSDGDHQVVGIAPAEPGGG